MPPVANAQPKPLERLIARLTEAIDATTGDLQQDDIGVDAWRDQVAKDLTTYHAAAYLSGSGKRAMDDAGREVVAKQVKVQLGFLDNFALEIQKADEFEAGWDARAAMYAESIKAPYWSGRTKLLPLPALPGDGTTQCKTHCHCLWSIDTLDEDAGDYDATWVRGRDDSCQTCVRRAQEWSPIRIRAGVLQ